MRERGGGKETETETETETEKERDAHVCVCVCVCVQLLPPDWPLQREAFLRAVPSAVTSAKVDMTRT